MGSFGENLRREREMRGISLDEIASSTKIGIRFLQAMENDDFEILPGGIFKRSFIRSYARYLGLDEEQVIAEYQMTAQPKELELGRLMFASSSNLPRSERRSFLMPVLLAIVMLAGAYALFRYTHRPEEILPASPGVAPSAAEPETSSPATAGGGGETSETSTARAQNPPTSNSESSAGGIQAPDKQTSSGISESQPSPLSATPGGAAAGSDMVLQLAATQRVWVSVDADGKTALQRTLNPQDTQTVKAKDHFDLMTGNAQGLILTLNGETLKPLGRVGEVKKVHLTRSDVRLPPP
jgi:cytoskeleton protein RodZ